MPLHLGIDASTQSMSAVLIDAERPECALCESVNFERELPQYGTSAGAVAEEENPLEVWSYPLMWLDALDMLMLKLARRANLAEVVSVSGDGQQHASVWLNTPDAFLGLDPSKSLSQNLRPHLSRTRSPIWLDASTKEECAEMAAAAGGDERVLQKTGSVMTERFTGAQMRKIFKREPDVWRATRRIHLNSSFLCSALCGSDAPVDFGDGAGMNLMNLSSLSWDADMLGACAPNAGEKLPKLAPSSTVAGCVCEYFQKKYGFSKGVKVAIFTGDNPSSLVGSGDSSAGRATVSLGTSDTFFCALEKFSAAENAHIFGNPSGGFMGLVCFRNGSLARERLKDSLGIDWNLFDGSFESYEPRADSKFILPFYADETSPKLRATAPAFFGFERPPEKIETVRAFIEGQCFNMFLQAQRLGGRPGKITLTGGASKSEAIAQCLADVFEAEIFTISGSVNSAALGAAMRAAQWGGGESLEKLEAAFCKKSRFKSPRKEAARAYEKKIPEFAKLLEAAAKDK